MRVDGSSPSPAALKEWPLWEVFVRSKQGLEHKHCGSLHAADAAGVAVTVQADLRYRRLRQDQRIRVTAQPGRSGA